MKALKKEAKIQVELPVVKIRVEDLSYLKSLDEAGDKAIKCEPQLSSTLTKLRLVGLVEDKDIGPCPQEIIKRDVARAKIRETIIAATRRRKNWDWDKLYNMPTYDAAFRGKNARKIVVITEAGRKLIREGVAQSDVRKACA